MPRERSSSARSRARDSHCARTSAWSATPTRSSRATAAMASESPPGAPPGDGALPEADPPGEREGREFMGAAPPVDECGVGVVVVEPGRAPRAGAAPGPPASITAVVGCTDTTPSGTVAVTVSSSVLHCAPMELRRVRVVSAVGKSGPRSRGSSVTESPTRTTLPSNAERSTRSATPRPAGGNPCTSMLCAPVTCAARTVTRASSPSPQFAATTSSTTSTPLGEPAAAAATTAPVVRAPTISMASHSRMPRARITSGCARTIPRRASAAEAVRRRVRSRSGRGFTHRSLTAARRSERAAVRGERCGPSGPWCQCVGAMITRRPSA